MAAIGVIARVHSAMRGGGDVGVVGVLKDCSRCELMV